MRFWDTSALVPLLVQEKATPWAESLLSQDPEVVVFWLAEAEATSALNRRRREGALSEKGYKQAKERLSRLRDSWHEVLPTEAVKRQAIKFLELYPLRTLDALQLGALWVFSEGNPLGTRLVSLDLRLIQAAEQVGFPVEKPTPFW
ncbi:PIN domain-containing protein [Thermus scotoductus]|uniref:PIN domain-containing protein n=1 Tax=Thermus scotoductus TaxID=37636 RepID=A0A430SBA6_THESC|nr:type II toxin-antitoxin system VapC family toxin [Thermus scotoductus]RTG98768.1 PIN domain-containing protein [Thermus scotoductus]RTH33360.1 PIN domain-containing protein [Thermus scotoductus]RTH96357.1 PIN domain-containing protein [Thermus scotoductus]RTI13604.1 PIN domain-containing protein [Thermus scotoductus]